MRTGDADPRAVQIMDGWLQHSELEHLEVFTVNGVGGSAGERAVRYTQNPGTTPAFSAALVAK